MSQTSTNICSNTIKLSMFLDEYFLKDPRKFFFPLLDYAISEYLGENEKELEDLGYKYAFSGDLETRRIVEKDGKIGLENARNIDEEVIELIKESDLEPDVDKFPIGAYNVLRKGDRVVIIGFGNDTLSKIGKLLGFNVDHKNVYKLVSKTEAGAVPVVHSHLLFKGCPHPLVDGFAFERISKLGGFKPFGDEVDKTLVDFSLRFKDVFSDWSVAVKDIRLVVEEIEEEIESEKGARRLYAMAQVLGADIDLPDVWEKISRVISLPSKPNLEVTIFTK